MNKKSLLNFWLLLLCMIVGSGTAWAVEKTITLDYSSFGLNTTYASKTATVDGIGFTVNQGYKGSGNTIQMNSTKGTGTLYNTTAITGLKSIKVNVASGNKTYTITTGTSQNPTANSQTGTTTGTYNAVSGDTYFQLKVSGASYFTSIVITYDDGPALEDNDFALTGAPVALNFDLYNNASAQVINYTTSSTGAVTIADSEYATFAINETAKTITVTPTAVTPSMQTITVNQAADETYKVGSVTFTLTITDSTPLPTYTVTFSDGGSVTQESYGASVTLPSRSETAGYAFAGWSETNVASETTEAPTIIPAGSYTPTDDITLYPVYKKTEGASAPSPFSVGDTGSFAIVSEAFQSNGNYYALPTNPTVDNGKIKAIEITISEMDGVKYVTPANATGFTWTIAAATNGYTLSDGSHYIYHSNGGSSGTNLTYGDATTYTWAFTADGDYIKMAGMSGSTTNSRGMLFSGTTIGGYALSNWGSNGYYKTMILPISEGATIYYWSSPVEAAVKKPVITVADNPFLFSTTATITCATEGAAIKYSFDGESWNDYSTALTITATTTIYAKAVKDENESNVASVTATKNLAEPVVTIDATGITNTNVFEGTEAGSLSATVTYNEATVEGAVVTWSGDNDEVATINAETGAVTLVAAGSVTFTATYAGNGDYSEKTATYDMTVDALSRFTVTFSDGGSVTQESYGASVTLPSRSETAGYAFAGWSETNVASETTEAPTIIPAGSYTPTANITLYPVYTKTEGGGGNVNKTTSVNIATYATANSWVNGVQYEEVFLDENVTATANGGGNTGKYYTTGNEWRFYQGEDAYLVIETTSGTLTSAKITYNISNSGQLTYEETVVNSGSEIDLSGTSACFWVENSGSATNGQVKITAIEVNYSITGGGTTYYWSAPVAAAVEKPTITVAENPFLFSTSVEITCETDGATIYYTLDGTDPTDASTEYSDAFEITSACTIKAIAIKGSDESSIATLVVEKNQAEPTVTVSGDLTVDLNGETDVNAGTLTAAVTYNEAAVDGATVTWISSDPDVATIGENTGVVTIKTRGSVTFTATYAGNSDYAEATGTKTITVTDSKAPGMKNNPYTVAQARAAIDAGTGVTGVYATGIVSTAGSLSSGSISYYISDDGTKTNELQAYRGKSYDGNNFTSANDIQVGDVVVIYGNLKKYNAIYEFDSNNQLVSLVRKISTPTFSPEAGVVAAGTKVTISCDVDDVTIYYTTDGTTPTTESTEYTEAITIDAATTINAFAVKEGWVDSDVASVSYTVAAQVATPTFSPAAGTYTSAQNVEISTETEDATIYYTTDGTTPTEESTVYTEAITVDETMTIKAIAVKEGMVNSNVAEAAYTMNIPSIITDVTSVNAVAKGENGTINVTYSFIASDPEIVWYTDETATVTTDKPDWISASFDESNNIEYGIDANTGEARTAYLKVYGLDSETNDVYSSLITISQVEYVAPVTYSLATSITSGKHYLITNGSNRAMGYDKGNNRDVAEITISEGKVTVTAEDTEVYEFIIYGPDANGYYTIYDATTENEDGKHYLYAASSGSNYLKTQSTNDMNGKWAIEINNTGIATIKAKGDYSRNWMRYNSSSSLFSCYASGQSDIYLYEKDDDTPVATTASVKLNASGYATFATTSALDFLDADNADFSAWQITNVSSSSITFSQIKSMVEAGTGILVKGTPGATVNLNILPVGGVKLGDNKLEGITEATAIESDTYYGLSGNKFVKVNAGTVPAGKALLPASEISASARELTFVFNDGTTGISSIEKVQLTNDKYYNLNGQCVENPKKGSLYIVNGKKVIMK